MTHDDNEPEQIHSTTHGFPELTHNMDMIILNLMRSVIQCDDGVVVAYKPTTTPSVFYALLSGAAKNLS